MKAVYRIISIAVVAIVLPATAALAGGDRPYPFGDAPYLTDDAYAPAVAAGCLRWNWQQHSWYDHCPRYIHPKAYVYPRVRYGTVLRSRG